MAQVLVRAGSVGPAQEHLRKYLDSGIADDRGEARAWLEKLEQ